MPQPRPLASLLRVNLIRIRLDAWDDGLGDAGSPRLLATITVAATASRRNLNTYV